jgi:hypothetical protein
LAIYPSAHIDFQYWLHWLGNQDKVKLVRHVSNHFTIINIVVVVLILLHVVDIVVVVVVAVVVVVVVVAAVVVVVQLFYDHPG